MAKVLDQPRYKCALAAMQTVHAITGALPIIHSGPGCASKLNENTGTGGFFNPNVFPCTSISEKEVVFGGNNKLRSTIHNAFRVIDADLYVVLSGCMGEIVGDDIQEVTEEFTDSGKDIVWVKTPGFQGNNYLGHDWVLKAIFQQLLANSIPQTEEGLVNLFVSVPQQDPYWLGNLREIESLLESIGLKPNTIFGFDRGVENIRKIPNAQFSILIAPWAGLESAKYLEEKYKIPLLHYPTLPIGSVETTKFLRAVQKFTNVSEGVVEAVIKQKEREYYYYMERFADTIIETRILGKRFTIVSDSHYVVSVTKFLVNDLGLIPEKVYIVDDTPEKYRQSILDELKDLNNSISADVVFSTSGFDIHNEIEKFDIAGNFLILGSDWEKKFAQAIGAYYVNISYPMIEKLVIGEHIAGYTGGLHLLSQIFTAALSK